MTITAPRPGSGGVIPGRGSRGCQAALRPGDPFFVSDCPDFRLTVRRGRVLAIDWGPWLVCGGPMTTMLRARGRAGVAIADLTVQRDDDGPPDAIVRFLAGDRPESRAAIARWAEDVGYLRVWFPDEVVELSGPADGDAETRCSGCGVHLVDGEPEFWEHVRRAGRFPAACPLCGADLPQWRVRRPADATGDAEHAATEAPMAGSRRRCA